MMHEEQSRTEPQPCPNCHTIADTVRRRHMNTAYCDEESNYITCCLPCFEMVEEYWQERWDDLNADRMRGILDGQWPRPDTL